uniref:Uncharacterized protein n=1 Tax=Lepeophtheirus salmonis TaxID=72036 RepID=A0A0K2UV73_LEPSM
MEYEKQDRNSLEEKLLLNCSL